MNRRHVTALVFVLCCSTSSLAENWPNWRGPNFDGVAAPGDYPVQWTTTENVIWKVALPSSAGSTPIVWGDHIFVDGARDGKNLVQCFDWDGNIQWEREQGTERQGKHRKGSGANPSPVTDGQHVYCYFKSGDLSCYDFTGKLIWQKNLQAEFGPDSLWWDLGTSPVLTDNCVIVACMQDAPSYVVALDKRTGKQVWKVDRNLNAPEESHQAYTTPIVTKRGDTTVLLVLGSDHLTAHDAQTGTELWRSAGFNRRNAISLHCIGGRQRRHGGSAVCARQTFACTQAGGTR